MQSQKEVQSLANKNTMIEHHERIKLNTSTLDKKINERYRHDGFS